MKRAIDKEITGLIKLRQQLDRRMIMFRKFKEDVSDKRTLLKKQAELEKQIDILKKVKTSRNVDKILDNMEKSK